jgi:hypothetical protein
VAVPIIFEVLNHGELAARSASFPGARWLTWSAAFRRCLDEHRSWARVLRPTIIHLARAKEYSYTFTVTRAGWHSSAFARDLRPFLSEFLAFDPSRSIYFLTALSTVAQGWPLHTLFATLRAAMAAETGDAWAVMYAPLANVGKHAGEFPLHADLYLPEVLVNAFEVVPGDGSGRTTLLPIDDFFRVLRASAHVPAAARDKMAELLLSPLGTDAYTEFYNLLHGSENSWTAPLDSDLRTAQRVIALGRYEGYLLHDRRWLHGREAPSSGVSRNRLRRLIYRPFAAQSA